ncbi:hypothetical protein TcasGA2_TC008824 [Tribolium castaneum]|uniref:Uncharacterized protein n=1 Tax=Tribolium castaneum TaxID=7070 RepID=D6WR78_TRICA|nr:hypothetical protein TcasGA2_TC008824 [Tribolium castaneum]
MCHQVSKIEHDHCINRVKVMFRRGNQLLKLRHEQLTYLESSLGHILEYFPSSSSLQENDTKITANSRIHKEMEYFQGSEMRAKALEGPRVQFGNE